MSRYYPPKINPLAPLASAPETPEAAKKQMLEDSAITRGNVLAHMDITAAQRAELEAAMALFSQMLIGDLSDDAALEAFQ